MKTYFWDIFNGVDKITQGHAARVSVIAREVATEMGYSDEDINFVLLGASVHDAGKIITQHMIVDTNKEPTESEWKIIRLHTIKGYELLS